MATTRPQHRIFALIMALLFLATSIAGGALVLWQINQDSKDQAALNSLNESLNKDDTDSCQIGATEGVGVLPAPEAFKPAGDVTQLETTDLSQGTGDAVKAGDCVVAKYYGTLATTGEMFDENFTKAQGLKFQVGIGTVIQGWDEGVVGMKAGGMRRLVIPSDKAYGENGSGSIPANADLVFVVKLEQIVK